MSETYSGRVEGMDAEQYSMKHFEGMAQQARKAEEKRVDQGIAVGSLDLKLAVVEWAMDRENILKAIGDVLDKMLAVDDRRTGTFEVTVELPRQPNFQKENHV